MCARASALFEQEARAAHDDALAIVAIVPQHRPSAGAAADGRSTSAMQFTPNVSCKRRVLVELVLNDLRILTLF